MHHAFYVETALLLLFAWKWFEAERTLRRVRRILKLFTFAGITVKGTRVRDEHDRAS